MIPLLDLKKQYNSIKEEVNTRLLGVLESGSFILGNASGTDALELALKALGIGEGDEVITSPFTFIATAEAISQVGAKIVFSDIDTRTYNLDPEALKKNITKKTKAIIPVHLYGQPCNMDKIMSLAKENNLMVVEDCAQAMGAEYKGKRVGSFGDVGAFSFFPSKNLGGYGDGGMITTNNEEMVKKILMLRVHGSRDKYFHIIKGRNSRLDEIQASILRVKLKYLGKWNEERFQKSEVYNRFFKESGLLEEKVVLPVVSDNIKHVFNLYVIRAKKRDELFEFLKSKKISTGIHYPLPLHLQEVYKTRGYKRGDFPNSELVAGEVISLPFYPEITEEDIKTVVDTVREFYGN